MRPAFALTALLTLILTAGTAAAGRRPFIWPYDTEVLAARTVELEAWTWNRKEDTSDLVSLWLAPVVGLGLGAEIAVPIEFFWHEGGRSNLETIGLDLRWRLPSAGTFSSLIRAGVKRLPVTDSARIEADLVLAVDAGPVHAVLDPAIVISTDGDETDATFGAGISYALSNELKIAAETFSVIVLDSATDAQSWIMVGPDLAFTRGRLWVTAGVLVGISEYAPVVMPRIIWAVQF